MHVCYNMGFINTVGGKANPLPGFIKFYCHTVLQSVCASVCAGLCASEAYFCGLEDGVSARAVDLACCIVLYA